MSLAVGWPGWVRLRAVTTSPPGSMAAMPGARRSSTATSTRYFTKSPTEAITSPVMRATGAADGNSDITRPVAAAMLVTRSSSTSQLAGRASSVPSLVAATKTARGMRSFSPEPGSFCSISVRSTSPPRLWQTASATMSPLFRLRSAASSASAFSSGVSDSVRWSKAMTAS